MEGSGKVGRRRETEGGKGKKERGAHPQCLKYVDAHAEIGQTSSALCLVASVDDEVVGCLPGPVGHRRHTVNENGSNRRPGASLFYYYYTTVTGGYDNQSSASPTASDSRRRNIITVDFCRHFEHARRQ